MFTSRGAELPETTSNSFRVKIIRADSLYGLPPAATACHCLPRGKTPRATTTTTARRAIAATHVARRRRRLCLRCGRLKRVHQLGSCQREHLIEATVAINKLQTDQHCGQPKNTREYTRTNTLEYTRTQAEKGTREEGQGNTENYLLRSRQRNDKQKQQQQQKQQPKQ